MIIHILRTIVLLMLALGILGWPDASNANTPERSTAADCLPVLSKDYFSYAQKESLEVDFLKSIDSRSWDEMKTSNEFAAYFFLPIGIFSAKDNFAQFEKKRRQYLESINYSRSEKEALDILRIATGERAYPAYEACLRALPIGSGLSVWASRQSLGEIDLRIRYSNPSGVESIKLKGTISGGQVDGVPQNLLWSDKDSQWGVNEEKLVTIRTLSGTSETTIVVTPSDGSSPATRTFLRADARIQLVHTGKTETFRRIVHEQALTPNNDHVRGVSCPRAVGTMHGKWCISETKIIITTSPPRFFKNPKTQCEIGGCAWSTDHSLTVSPDRLTIVNVRRNWGLAVRFHLEAEEWETLTTEQCTDSPSLPIVVGQSLLFSTPTECLPIAVIRWTEVRNSAEHVSKFGIPPTLSESSPMSLAIDSEVTTGSARIVGYRLDSRTQASHNIQ